MLKKRMPQNAADEIEYELLYLQACFESMYPEDLLIRCQFYQKGIKVNRNRQVLK